MGIIHASMIEYEGYKCGRIVFCMLKMYKIVSNNIIGVLSHSKFVTFA